jgi:hypothetical protein
MLYKLSLVWLAKVGNSTVTLILDRAVGLKHKLLVDQPCTAAFSMRYTQAIFRFSIYSCSPLLRKQILLHFTLQQKLLLPTPRLQLGFPLSTNRIRPLFHDSLLFRRRLCGI